MQFPGGGLMHTPYPVLDTVISSVAESSSMFVTPKMKTGWCRTRSLSKSHQCIRSVLSLLDPKCRLHCVPSVGFLSCVHRVLVVKSSRSGRRLASGKYVRISYYSKNRHIVTVYAIFPTYCYFRNSKVKN